MTSPFDGFLKRNSIAPIEGRLPLVHSTRSFNLRELIETSGLNPKGCKVYDEKLLYFFLGRPSYRWARPDGTPEDWELPTCFVFDEIIDLEIRRILPFDSGAHAAKRYPSYIQNIPNENFQTDSSQAPDRIVSAFFGSFKAYLDAKPKSQEQVADEFSLGPLDAEVLAIGKLAGDTSASGVDDRRFSIEIQSKSSVSFNTNPPSAVILPTPYLKDEAVRSAISGWGAQAINYDTFGLSLSSYFGSIFVKFSDYCQARGFI